MGWSKDYRNGEDDDARRKRIARQDRWLRIEAWAIGIAALATIAYLIANW